MLDPAPEWEISAWVNSPGLTLRGLRGRAVVVLAFQMLCQGCREQALPQILRAAEIFSEDEVSFVGLHTVFRHHAEQGADPLASFVRAQKLNFPIGIDRADASSPAPITMRRYAMEGTPTLLLIDRLGVLQRQHFGPIEDMELGAEIAVLLGAA